MYKLCYYRYLKPCVLFSLLKFEKHAMYILIGCHILCHYRFVETDGKGFDRVRRTEIGKKYFKLTHFEEVRQLIFNIILISFLNLTSFTWSLDLSFCIEDIFGFSFNKICLPIWPWQTVLFILILRYTDPSLGSMYRTPYLVDVKKEIMIYDHYLMRINRVVISKYLW